MDRPPPASDSPTADENDEDRYRGIDGKADDLQIEEVAPNMVEIHSKRLTAAGSSQLLENAPPDIVRLSQLRPVPPLYADSRWPFRRGLRDPHGNPLRRFPYLLLWRQIVAHSFGW
jgi:hypothetical protein